MFLAVHPKITIRSGQGVGKTGLEACALLWFLCCFPNSRVVATAPTRQQLHDVLWSEISKWQACSPLLKKMLKWTKTRVCMLGHEERWFAVARTATKPENMQGFHEDNMLFIVDEASGVADPIMEAILGTLSGSNNKLLMCGNPTRRSGVFYDSHHVDKDLYRRYRISSLDSTRTSKDNIKSLIRKYGKNSNVVRVRIFGEFPIDEDDVFITSALAEGAMHVEKDLEEIETIDIGVDVARHGNDNTVIAVKLNNTVLPLIVRRGQDLMRTANEVVAIAKKYYSDYEKNVNLKIDDTGLGGGVTDRVLEIQKEQNLSFLIVTPINMARSSKHAHYGNMTTLMWGVLNKLLVDGELSLPNDNELIAELTTRKKEFSSNGKIILESKDNMKKRGLPSPDRADALTLAVFNIGTSTYERSEGGERR